MLIEFGSAKDIANQKKHGISQSVANELNWEAALIWVDDRYGYNETRMIARSENQYPLLRGIC